MDLRIDVFHHFDAPELKSLLAELRELIMTTQAQLAQALVDLGMQLDKARGEITQKVADLEAAILAAGNVTPEVQSAFDALKAKVQVLDDLNPDVP